MAGEQQRTEDLRGGTQGTDEQGTAPEGKAVQLTSRKTQSSLKATLILRGQMPSSAEKSWTRNLRINWIFKMTKPRKGKRRTWTWWPRVKRPLLRRTTRGSGATTTSPSPSLTTSLLNSRPVLGGRCGLRRGSSTCRPAGSQGGSSEYVVSGVDFEGAGATVQPTITQLPTELRPAGCKEVAEVSCWSGTGARLCLRGQWRMLHLLGETWSLHLLNLESPCYHLRFELNLDVVWVRTSCLGKCTWETALRYSNLFFLFSCAQPDSKVLVFHRRVLERKCDPHFVTFLGQLWLWRRNQISFGKCKKKKKKRTKITCSAPPIKHKAIWWWLHPDLYGLYGIQWSLCCYSSQFLPMISKWIPCHYFCDWKWSFIDFTKIITMPITYGCDVSQLHKLQIEQPYYNSQLTFTWGSLCLCKGCGEGPPSWQTAPPTSCPPCTTVFHAHTGVAIWHLL